MRSRSALALVPLAVLLLCAAPVLGAGGGNGASVSNYETMQKLKRERVAKRRAARAKRLSEATASLRKAAAVASRARGGGRKMKAAVRAEAEEKLRWLSKRMERAKTNVIEVSSGEYVEYVNNAPRMHWSFVVYTARDGRYRCPLCREAHGKVLRLAQSLNYTAEQPTFVIEVDIGRNKDIFDQIGLKHAPMIALVPPSSGTRKPKVSTLFNKLPEKYKSNVNPQTTADDFRKLVQRHSKQDVELVEEAVDYGNLFVLALMIGGIGAVLYLKGGELHRLREVKLPYFVSACAVFVWLSGGGMYNIIRGTQFTGDAGQLFHPANGNQYGLGGFIVGLLNLGVGLSFVFMNTLALRAPADGKTPSLTPMEQIRQRKPTPQLCLFAAIFLWYNLVWIYSFKNRSYNMGFVRA